MAHARRPQACAVHDVCAEHRLYPAGFFLAHLARELASAIHERIKLGEDRLDQRARHAELLNLAAVDQLALLLAREIETVKLSFV